MFYGGESCHGNFLKILTELKNQIVSVCGIGYNI